MAMLMKLLFLSLLLFASIAQSDTNKLYSAHIRRVVDGDTAQVDIHLGLAVTLHDQQIRFLDCNAPERFTSNGPLATAIVRRWLPTNQAIMLEMPVERDGSERKEKYGRWLATVIVGGTNLSKQLTATHTNIFKP